MEIYTSSDAKREFGEVLTKSQREPISVTRNGKPVAVVLSSIDYEKMKLQVLRSELVKGLNSPGVDSWDIDEFLNGARKHISVE